MREAALARPVRRSALLSDDGGAVPVVVPRRDEHAASAGTASDTEIVGAREAPDPRRGALHCRIVDDAAGLAALRSAWEALEAADPECTPFNTYRWNAAWWAHYGAGRRLRVVVVEARGHVVGIAPFQLGREVELGVLPRTVLRFVGSGGDTSPDYLGIVCEPALREEIARCVLDAVFWMPEWHTLRLRDLRAGSTLDELVERWFARARGVARPVHSKRVLVADLPDTWEAFRDALPRKRRKQLNHRANRLARAGKARVSIADEAAGRECALEALVRLHRERWAQKGEPGGFRTEAYEAFHRDVIERFAARDELWLVTLELDGGIIGVMYLYRWRDELMFFQSGFAPEHEALSPGHVMFEWVFREGIRRGLRRADMLKGEYHYKTAWARRETWLRDHAFHRAGPSAWLVSLRRRFGRTAAASPPRAPRDGTSST